MRQNCPLRMDNRKITTTSYLAAAGLVWFLSRSFIFWMVSTFYKVRKIPALNTIKELVPFVLFVVTFGILLKHPKVNEVMDEVVSELKKVSWPSKDDVIKSTWVVMVCILICSFILAGFDLLWGKLIGLLLS